MKLRPVVISFVVMATCGLIVWGVLSPRKPASSGQPNPIAVQLATASVREVPLWLSGIGNVQANNTVTVRPQVSGQLASVQFTEGQMVKAGDILAQIDPRPYRAALAQAIAQKAQDEARLANDQREYERIRALVETNAESRQLLDQRTATLAQSAALVQASQAAVDTAQLNLDFTALRAPIDGRTGVRLVDAGNLVTASQNNGLVVITQTAPVSILFTLPQQTFSDLRQGIVAAGEKPLPVEATDENGRALARGHLLLVDNQIDTGTGTLRLKATFANDDQTLWPGQFVTARVLVQTLANALTIPAESVEPGLDGPFVYVVKSDSTVEARLLTLGPKVGDLTVVLTGLSAGERVVREGQNKLQPGARVEPVKLPEAPSPAASAASDASAR
jgi:multidrug efflux system membrane fusion protein